MGHFSRLDDWIQIKISGPQTFDYLNGIITLDLETINDNKYYRSAFLTPNAKVRSVYWLKMEGKIVYMYCPGEMKNLLVEDLLKYKLSMDVKLEDISTEVPPLYMVQDETSEVPGLSNENISFTLQNLQQAPTGSELTYDQLKFLMIDNGLLPVEFMSDQNPYEVGINDTISLEKGCFLGQEPLSRMFHRGNLRKYVYRFESTADIKNGISVTHDNNEVGEVIVSKSSPSGSTGFVYVNRLQDDMSQLLADSYSITVGKKVGYYPTITR